MTIEPVEFRKLVGRGLVEVGFKRVRGFWWKQGVDDQWAVTIRKSRWGAPSFQMDVQVDFQAQKRSEEPGSYPIHWAVFDLPPLKEAFGDMAAPWVAAVLQLDNGLADAKRLGGLEELLGLVAGYVDAHLTVESLREAYRAGDMRSVFLLREVRAFLSDSVGVWPSDWVDRDLPVVEDRRPRSKPIEFDVSHLPPWGRPWAT
jgi:hypothetical protein